MHVAVPARKLRGYGRADITAQPAGNICSADIERPHTAMLARRLKVAPRPNYGGRSEGARL